MSIKIRKRFTALLFLLSMGISLGSGFFAPNAHARALRCLDLPDLFEAYLQNHYTTHQLNDTLKSRTIDQFIKNIDPSKTTLLESDVAAIKSQLATAFDEMRKGNCATIESVHKIILSRVQENEAFVKKTLDDPNYKLDENVELTLNPDQRNQPKTTAERDELLKKMIHFQISNYLISDTTLPESKRLLKKRYELSTKRVNERKPDEYLNLYAEAFAQSLDPHSTFMPPDDANDFQVHMQLSFEGIGASLTSEDGYTIIEELIPGGGADKSGLLKPKDKIIAVKDEAKDKTPTSVIDMDLKNVVKLIRGPKNTKVTLSILRQGEKTEQFQVTIVRDKIDLKEQAAKLNIEKRKIDGKEYKLGVIDLPSFYGGGKGEGRSCFNDVRDLVNKAKTEKVDGIVLDLSRNGGGLLDEAVKIAGLFIKKGGIVATKDTDGQVKVLEDRDPDIVYTGPLVVMTSRLSASASEILAGALKDYRRALVVGGDHTFGKGTVQVLAGLPGNLGAMKVTTGMFFLPSGVSTQHMGVDSDIAVPSALNNDEIGEKKLDYSLPQQKIESFLSKEANGTEADRQWKLIDSNLVAKLTTETQKRIEKNQKFAKIRKELEEALKNKGRIRLVELRKRADEDKKAGKLKSKNAPRKKPKHGEEDNPLLEESVNVLVDLIKLQKSGA